MKRISLFILNFMFLLLTTNANTCNVSGDVGTYVVNQTWVIEFTDPLSNDTTLTFHVYIPQDNPPYQQVLNITSNYNYSYTYDEFGNRMVNFTFTPKNERIVIWLTSIVKTNYTVPVGEGIMENGYNYSSNLTEYDEDMISLVRNITHNRTDLTYLAQLLEWVNTNIEYDYRYQETNLPAEEVFRVKRGTCDEYSILYLSFLRMLGVRGRLIYGLVYSDDLWQKHAWVEYESDGRWYPADPSFLQMNHLSSTHIMLGKAGDPSQFHEYLSVRTRDPSLDYRLMGKMNITVLNSSCEKKPIITSKTEQQEDTLRLSITFTNPYDHTLIDTFSINYPKSLTLLHGEDQELIIIPPRGNITKTLTFSTPRIEPGYIYSFSYTVNTLCAEHTGSFEFGNNQVYLSQTPKTDSPLKHIDIRIIVVILLIVIVYLSSASLTPFIGDKK